MNKSEVLKRVVITIEGKEELFGLDGHIQEIYSLCRKYHTKVISVERSHSLPSFTMSVVDAATAVGEESGQSFDIGYNLGKQHGINEGTRIRKNLQNELRDHLVVRSETLEKNYPKGHDQRDGAQTRISEIKQILMVLDAIESLYEQSKEIK